MYKTHSEIQYNFFLKPELTHEKKLIQAAV